MLDVSSVEVWVEGRPILGPVSFHVGPGEAVAVTGPSGSGKSTLLSCLAGIIRPTSGNIRVGEVKVEQLGPNAAAEFRRSCVGQVFQDPELLGELSVGENVMLPALFRGSSAESARREAARALGSVELYDRFDSPIASLSGGELQRVAVARALVTPVQMLLADEPTASLDRTRVHGVAKQLLTAGRQAGASIVVATHDEVVADACDRRIDLDRLHVGDSAR